MDDKEASSSTARLVASDSDLPAMFSDPPEPNRMAVARARVLATAHELSLELASDELRLISIFLAALEEQKRS